MQRLPSNTEPSLALRGTAAVALLAEVAAAPDTKLLAGISGVARSGKSALLTAVEAQYREQGVDVSRGHTDADSFTIARRGSVLIDDAHQLSDSTLTRIHALVDEPDVSLIVAYGLWPQPAALRRLTAALEQHHPPVMLSPLPRDDISAYAAHALGGPAPAALVDQVAELTGGTPWLVERVVEELRENGRRVLSDPLVLRSVAGDISHELEATDNGLHELLLALAVGFDLSGRLPPSLAEAGHLLDTLVAEARSDGLVLADGQPVPLVRQALLETTPAYQVRSLQRALVDALVAEQRPLDEVALGLARGGLKDTRVAHTLEQEGDDALPHQPALAASLYEQAVAAGSDPRAVAARRAQAAAACGELDRAARILDGLLAQEDAPDVTRAVDVAAAVWAGRGMLARSAEMYRWLGPGRAGTSAALGAIAMLGTGDRDGAETMFGVPSPSGFPTLTTVAVTLMGQGIRQSVDGPAASALPTLVRASDMMTASGATAPLPDTPAALAAIVAIHSGELDVAHSVIDGAIAGGQGGPTARPRLLLLRAWAAMQADRPDRARRAIAHATSGDGPIAPRDNLLLCALEVGLARRADDAHDLVRAWQRARESVLHVPVDLFSLLPLGELLVAATRLRDADRVESALVDGWALLERLGEPPLWAVPLRWSAVQAAILTDRPSELAPHATALLRASQSYPLATVLAAAGRAWVSVLAGTFSVAAVESAARGLASVGRTWEGSRLAGHAAARAEERKDMARLLACARDLHPGVTPTAGTAPSENSASHPSGASRDDTGLSAREREVARLVLEGKTYSEIGEAIFISPRTVEHHIARIRRRLGATTRSELLTQLRIALGEHDLPSE